MKRILVSLPDGVVETLDNELIAKSDKLAPTLSVQNHELVIRTKAILQKVKNIRKAKLSESLPRKQTF
jgi:hypothetical protein